MSKNKVEFARIAFEIINIRAGWGQDSANYHYVFDDLDSVIKGALGNAYDTLNEGNIVVYGSDGKAMKIAYNEKDRTEEENDAFYAIALGSISCTAAFDTDALVRAFFKDIGYKY